MRSVTPMTKAARLAEMACGETASLDRPRLGADALDMVPPTGCVRPTMRKGPMTTKGLTRLRVLTPRTDSGATVPDSHRIPWSSCVRSTYRCARARSTRRADIVGDEAWRPDLPAGADPGAPRPDDDEALHVDRVRVEVAQRGHPRGLLLAGDDDDGRRVPHPEEDLTGLVELARSGPGARVVDSDDQVGRRGRPEPLGDDRPGFEPVGEADHGEVGTERRAHQGGCSLRGAHPGQDPDRDLLVCRKIRLYRFEHGRGHPEDAGVAAGDHGDVLAAQGQVEGGTGPVDLDGVAGGMAGQARSLRNTVDVGAVADDVTDGGEDLAGLGREPVVRAGAEPDDVDGAGGRSTRRGVHGLP